MTYIEWSDQVAAIVRQSKADTDITGEQVRNGPVNFLDDPHEAFSEGISPTAAAREIIGRITMLVLGNR